MGMSEYILYLIIHYVKKKKNDCIRWCNSCDVFGPFQEVCVKKAEIDINIYLQTQDQNGEITAVTMFPPKTADVFGEENLQEAQGNPNQLLEKFLLLENHDFSLSIFD